MTQIQTPRHLIALSFFSNLKGNHDLTHELLSGKKSSGMASFKLQMLPAIKAAKSLSIKPKLLSLQKPISFGEQLKKHRCMVLIGKMSANSEVLVQSMIDANLPTIKEMKQAGCPIVLQYSDHLLEEKNILGDFYKELFQLADQIVFPSETLRQLSSSAIPPRCRTAVIVDPWQLNSWHPPRTLHPDETCRLIWFGANKNIPYLQKALPNLIDQSSKEQRFELTVMGLPLAHQLIQTSLENQPLPDNWSLRWVEWNNKCQPDQLEQELSKAHICLIPSDPTDPLKTGVSHNRLVDAIRAGCLPMASPMPSYLELEDLSLLGNDMGVLLEQAIQNYEPLTANLSKRREEQLKRFSPQYNLQFWRHTLKRLIKNPPDRTG